MSTPVKIGGFLRDGHGTLGEAATGRAVLLLGSGGLFGGWGKSPGVFGAGTASTRGAFSAPWPTTSGSDELVSIACGQWRIERCRRMHPP